MRDATTIRERLRRGGVALVLGYGRSGRAACLRLGERGFACRVVDRGPRPAGEEAPRAWYRDEDSSALDGVDLVVKSPGVSRDHPLVGEAIARDIALVGELELGWALCAAPLYSITGSNGKSTTTALLAHLLAAGGARAIAAGNIGEPLSAVGPQIPATGAIAVEVSSFQIEDLVEYRSRGAALLNVTPDHLDRHRSLERYLAIKARLLDLVEDGGHRVLNGDDPMLRPLVAEWRRRDRAGTLVFSCERFEERGAYLDGDRLCVATGRPETIARVGELKLAGPHNVQNVLAAMAVAAVHGVDAASLRRGLLTFQPLRHRLEPVAEAGGVLFVNDSKATNLDSLRMAVLSYPDRRIVLIAGGRDKGSPFEELAPLVRERVAHLVLIGESSDRIASAWPGVPATRASSMVDAVARAHRAAEPAGVVLLAPGCASFDMFRDYADRGDQFCAAVRDLVAGGTDA